MFARPEGGRKSRLKQESAIQVTNDGVGIVCRGDALKASSTFEIADSPGPRSHGARRRVSGTFSQLTSYGPRHGSDPTDQLGEFLEYKALAPIL